MLTRCFVETLAQPAVKEVALTEKPQQVYLDRPGDLYIKCQTRIIHYDINGNQAGIWELANPNVYFEPRDGSRMFYFNPDDKTFGFTSFGKTPASILPQEYAIDPVLACSAGDMGIWIMDRSDYSFKRVNLKKGQVDQEFYIPENLRQTPIENIREYQSFLFAATPTRIYIFSAFGKLLKTLTAEGADFDFLGEELYYRLGIKLMFLDLFDGSQRQEEIKPDTLFVRITDERRFEIYADRMVIISD